MQRITMQDTEKYLPESRAYFRNHLKENKEEYYYAMREYNVGPGSGYWYFHRSNEVVDTMREIYHHIDETFGNLTIPGEFPSPSRLAKTWEWFYNSLKSKDELFEDVYNKLPSKDSIPAVLSGVNTFRHKIMDVLEHILDMNEVKELISPTAQADRNAQTEVDNENYLTDIAILTALHTPEFAKVKTILSNFSRVRDSEMKSKDDTVYYRGIIASPDRNISVIAANTADMGMPAATALAMKVIHHFRPKYLVMLGIAAGIKGKTQIGDVLIGEYMWNSGSGKRVKRTIIEKGKEKTVDDFVPYIHQMQLDSRLSSLFKHLASDKKYLPEIKASFPVPESNKSLAKELKHPISVVIGPFASGAAVIANESVVKEMQSQHGKLIGFDMEAYGVFFAAHHAPGKKATPISIKSVSDFGDSNKNTKNKDFHQTYAAHTSVEYFLQIATNELDYE